MENNMIGFIMPLHKKCINRIFNDNKDILVKFTTNEPSPKTMRLRPGHKIFMYKTGGDKQIVGEALIREINFLTLKEITLQHFERLFITKNELENYVGYRKNKKMLVITLRDIKKYDDPICLKNPVTMTGLYVTKSRYVRIFKNKNKV